VNNIPIRKKPKSQAQRKKPVAVRPYFKDGKRVAGYKRRKAGDGTVEEQIIGAKKR